MRFLSACGLPGAHVHAGNVIVDRRDGGWTCRISEWEMALYGAPSHSSYLAMPRLAHGARSFSVSRDVLTFGHLLYELLSCEQLTERELSRWQQSENESESVALSRSPAAAWALLANIFLPQPHATQAPTLIGNSHSCPFVSCSSSMVRSDA